MSKRIGIFYTVTGIMHDVREQFRAILPDEEMIEIMDGGVGYEELTHGVSPATRRRFADTCRYFEEIGCAAVLNTCSSLSSVIPLVQPMIGIPVFSIDAPMAEEAVEAGSRIAILKTILADPEPSELLVQETAARKSKQVRIDRFLIEGGMAAARSGNKELLAQLARNKVNEILEDYDVFLLAQVSLYPCLAAMKDVPKPVLNSLQSGVAQMKGV